MVQEFHVVECFSCQAFQVQQVKKSKKWTCKVCGKKQSVLKEYGRGCAADCRQHVQKLNSLRGELLEVNSSGALSQWEDDNENQNESVNEDSSPKSEEVISVSRWTKYIHKTIKDPQDEDEEKEKNIYTERDRFGNLGNKCRMSSLSVVTINESGTYFKCRKRKFIPKLKSIDSCGNLKDEGSWANCGDLKKQPCQHEGSLSSSWKKGFLSKYSSGSADVLHASEQHPSSTLAVSSYHTASTTDTHTVANSSHNQPRAAITRHLCLQKFDPKFENKNSKWNKFLVTNPSQEEEEEEGKDFYAHNLSTTAYVENTEVPKYLKALTQIHSEEPRCPLAEEINTGVLGRQQSVGDICEDRNYFYRTNSHTLQQTGLKKPFCTQPHLSHSPGLSVNSLFFTDEDFDDAF